MDHPCQERPTGKTTGRRSRRQGKGLANQHFRNSADGGFTVGNQSGCCYRSVSLLGFLVNKSNKDARLELGSGKKLGSFTCWKKDDGYLEG
jgi:hypothetical protein